MKWHPILFSAAMVRALIARRKSQTRRLVKPQPTHPNHYLQPMCGRSPPPHPIDFGIAGVWREVGPDYPDGDEDERRCPYGVPGDRLWVRETWQAWQCVSAERDEWEPITREVRGGAGGANWAEWVVEHGRPDRIEYRATSTSPGPWTPSIHLPRWASRITLDVTEVRVERLQAISEADAVAEGVEPTGGFTAPAGCWQNYVCDGPSCDTARESYRSLWESIRGPGSWAADPWVWVISFRMAAS